MAKTEKELKEYLLTLPYCKRGRCTEYTDYVTAIKERLGAAFNLCESCKHPCHNDKRGCIVGWTHERLKCQCKKCLCGHCQLSLL